MTFDEFVETIDAPHPPDGISPPLTALWYAKKGAWHDAHELCQGDSRDLAWVHAWLHRQEGDLGNANYWYRRANRPTPSVSLESEWEEIVKSFL